MEHKYLFVETLPHRASATAKYLQQARARSHAAAVSHRRSAHRPKTSGHGRATTESNKRIRNAWTAIYHISDSEDEEQDSPEPWPPPASTKPGPLALLGPGRRDPFTTHPVSKYSLRSDELFDFAANVAAVTMFDIQPKQTSNAIVTTIQLAMQDAAAFHAALALFASEKANTLGVSQSRETIYHKVECVRMISNRLNEGVSPFDGTIYAVILLWAFESTLAAPEALQAHINGLELMVERRGGISTLSPDIQCMLAWCVILNRGHSKIPFRKGRDTTLAIPGTPSGILSLQQRETWHFLSDLYWLSRSSPSIFQAQCHFFEPRSPLHRLAFGTTDLASLKAFPDPTKKNIISMPCLMCLLWVLAIFLDHAQSPVQLADELQGLQERLKRHKLDRFGSPMMLCWVLLRKEDSGELHPRSWAVVRHISFIKRWNTERQQHLSTFLNGFLLRNETGEAQQQRYYSIMESMMEAE